MKLEKELGQVDFYKIINKWRNKHFKEKEGERENEREREKERD